MKRLGSTFIECLVLNLFFKYQVTRRKGNFARKRKRKIQKKQIQNIKLTKKENTHTQLLNVKRRHTHIHTDTTIGTYTHIQV